MNKSLTDSLKRKYLPIIIQRDGGLNCLYCPEILSSDYVFDHLNNQRQDNRVENIITSHQSCNIEKINNIDFQLIAAEKLKQNEEAGLKYLEDQTAHENNSSEIEINKALYSFHKKYISERIASDRQYLFDDAIAELPYLCQERFGHGSEATTRKYIKQLTCKAADWQVVKDDKGKKLICKRNVLN